MSPLPLKIASDVKFKQVACGGFHTVALASDGRLFVCGLNNHGQLGLGTQEYAQQLTQILNISQIVQVQAGTFFTMALTSEGNVLTTGLHNLQADNEQDRLTL